MEYEAIQAFFTVVLAVCGGIVCIAGACAAVVKFWRWAHKDSEKNAEDLESFKKAVDEAKDEYLRWFASDKRRIQNLEDDYDEIIEQNNLLMKAVVAIMDHQLDGNHVEKLAKARNEVDEYLIDNKTKKRRDAE